MEPTEELEIKVLEILEDTKVTLINHTTKIANLNNETTSLIYQLELKLGILGEDNIKTVTKTSTKIRAVLKEVDYLIKEINK